MYESSTQFLHDLVGLCGYTGYGLTQDGAVLCEPCMHEEHELISRAIDERNAPCWEVVHIDIHWEGVPLYCEHCSEPIEPCYE